MWTASALCLALALPASGTDPIDWIHDDWDAARDRAQKTKTLIAIDVWATWCHTCLAMKNFTLKEAPLAAVAETHTWLSLDFDRPKNAAFFRKFPVNAFPTFLVVDPEANQVVDRWVGSGTAEQMAEFFRGARKTDDAATARGQRALAAGRYADAARIFATEVAKKPRAGHNRTLLLAGYIEALWKSDQQRCAIEGVKYLDQTDDTAPGVDYTMLVQHCAEALEGAEKKAVLAKIRDRLAKVVANPDPPLSPDDQSSVYGSLIGLHKALGDKDQAKAMLVARIGMLEKAAKAAATPKARATYDAHRLGCYLEMKRYADAEAMLRASERALPDDFNPPWRLAILYRDTRETAKGLTAIERALAKGYGGRRLRLYSTKIDLLLGAGQAAAAQKAYDAGQAELETIDPTLVRASWRNEFESKARAIKAALAR